MPPDDELLDDELEEDELEDELEDDEDELEEDELEDIGSVPSSPPQPVKRRSIKQVTSDKEEKAVLIKIPFAEWRLGCSTVTNCHCLSKTP